MLKSLEVLVILGVNLGSLNLRLFPLNLLGEPFPLGTTFKHDNLSGWNKQQNAAQLLIFQ